MAVNRLDALRLFEPAAPTAERRCSGLFSGYWSIPGTGERLGRATRAELREAYRLWVVHRDIREGRPET